MNLVNGANYKTGHAKSEEPKTLLSYEYSTFPHPLQVSPSKTQTSYGSIRFVISNDDVLSDGDVIDFKEIKITFPRGSSADDLSDDFAVAEATCDLPIEWIETKINRKNGEFRIKVKEHNDPETKENRNFIRVSDKGFYVQMDKIPINTEIGTVTIFIEENSRYYDPEPPNNQKPRKSESNEYEFQDYKVKRPLTKFPFGFYVGDFKSDKPWINSGGEVTLTWYGSTLATYSIEYGTNKGGKIPHEFEGKDRNSRKLKVKNLLTTTTFYLIATVSIRGDLRHFTLNTTVVVANPDLVAKSLAISNKSEPKEIGRTGRLFVENVTEGSGATHAGRFESKSTDNATVYIANKHGNGGRGLTIRNKSKSNSTLYVENEYQKKIASAKGYSAAKFVNKSISNGGTATLQLVNNGGGKALYAEGDVEIKGTLYVSDGIKPQHSAPKANSEATLAAVKNSELLQTESGLALDESSLQGLLESAVKTISNQDGSESLALDNHALVMHLFGALKALAKQNDELAQRIELLEANKQSSP